MKSIIQRIKDEWYAFLLRLKNWVEKKYPEFKE